MPWRSQAGLPGETNPQLHCHCRERSSPWCSPAVPWPVVSPGECPPLQIFMVKQIHNMQDDPSGTRTLDLIQFYRQWPAPCTSHKKELGASAALPTMELFMYLNLQTQCTTIQKIPFTEKSRMAGRNVLTPVLPFSDMFIFYMQVFCFYDGASDKMAFYHSFLQFELIQSRHTELYTLSENYILINS